MPDSTNTGGRKPRVTDDDLLDVFRATADPVLSTAEVADAVPIKRRGTLNRLRDLEDAGTLDSKQIGGRNTVWWLAEDAGRSRPTPDQSPTNSVGRYWWKKSELLARLLTSCAETTPVCVHGSVCFLCRRAVLRFQLSGVIPIY